MRQEVHRAFWVVGLLAYWALLLRHAAPTVTVGDSGEFIVAGVTLSFPHPPGYPLYSLLGKCFHTLIPWGNSGYRLNILSAALNGVSLLLFGQLGRRLRLSKAAVAFGVCCLAASPSFYQNGLVTEVFALNTAAAFLLTGLAVGGGLTSLFVVAYMAGLVLGNHHTLALLAPGLFLWWFLAPGLPMRKKHWGLAALFFCLGFSIYVYLLFRSRQNPPLDWGNPETWTNLWRTVSRRDYGSFTLALGETPARTLANTWKHLSRLAKGLWLEVSPIGLVLAFLGACALWVRSRPTSNHFGDGLVVRGLFRRGFWATAAFLILTGPFFVLLGNLPFDDQSDNVLKRFLILPAAVLAGWAACGFGVIENKARRWTFLLFAAPVFVMWRSVEAFPFRWDLLTWDYSLSVLRTLPPRASLFMDGGDDTFFSLAFQRYGRQQRPDLALFDRGGLIFKSAYGADFRSLSKENKENRRHRVEKDWSTRHPLYYSTMNEKIHPDLPLTQSGFLYRAPTLFASVDLSWDLYVLRALYPPVSREYRTRALAAYFPFMRAKSHGRERQWAAAQRWLARAEHLGAGVPWFAGNAAMLCEVWAYELFQTGDLASAEAFYDKSLTLWSRNPSAWVNRGVLAEKKGDLARARQCYERAIQLAPQNPDALYALAVVEWKEGHWAEVVRLLEQVLRWTPTHEGAARYLPLARKRL